MTATIVRSDLDIGPPDDTPRRLINTTDGADRAFRVGTRGVGIAVLVMVGAIGVFLGLQLVPTLQHYGIRFFTGEQVNPEKNQVGIASAIVGSIEISVRPTFTRIGFL